MSRAMLVESERGRSTRVLMSEIIIPAPAEYAAEARQLAEQVSHIRGEGEFGKAARQVFGPALRDTASAGTGCHCKTCRARAAPGDPSAEARRGDTAAGSAEPGASSCCARSMRAAPSARSRKARLCRAGARRARLEQAAELTARVASQAKRCDDLYTIAKDALRAP